MKGLKQVQERIINSNPRPCPPPPTENKKVEEKKIDTQVPINNIIQNKKKQELKNNKAGIKVNEQKEENIIYK